LSKKPKPAKKPIPRKPSFDFESSPWFVPVAFGLMTLALIICFREFIFSDKMLYASDTIQAGIFMRAFYIDYFLQHGSIPGWNPYIFGGMPYVDAFHGDIFYPLSILKFGISLYRGPAYLSCRPVHVFRGPPI
jgi:hypothetical protein